MRKKAAILLCAVLAFAFFTGCSAGFFDSNNLMAPPAATGEKHEIQTLLKTVAGDDLKLCYPETGSYRSAIINSSDFTGDGIHDVVGFYYENGESESESVSVVMMAEDENGEFSIVLNLDKNYSRVDRVFFADLDGDRTDEIIIGWGNPLNQSGNICVYDYQNGSLVEYDLEKSYTEMSVGDFTGDGTMELITLELSKTETAENVISTQPAFANLFDFSDGSIEHISKIKLDSSAEKYSLVTTGKINNDTYACVIDCVRSDNEMFTQIVYYRKSLRSLEVMPEMSGGITQNVTSRHSSVLYSKDVNLDGFIEIPTEELLPSAYTKYSEKQSANYLISWNRVDMENNQLLMVQSEIINTDYGYSVAIPAEWKGKFCIYSGDNVMSLYEWDGVSKGELLFKIIATDEDNVSNYFVNYDIVYRENGKVFLAVVGTESEMNPDINVIKRNFSVIS